DLVGTEDFLDGRILTADRAQELRLIDSIGYLDDAVQIAAEQVGCGGGYPVMLHRARDRADTPYAITPNTPIQGEILPVDIPGITRADLPTFLYMWQPNPSYGG